MLRKRTCEVCLKQFEVVLPPSRQKTGRGRFCSKGCKIQWTKGKHFSPETQFKKGMKMTFTPEHRRKISDARKGHRDSIGPKNGRWLGDKVGYYGLHAWIGNNLVKPASCEHCGVKKNLQWANKTYKYKRDASDWLALCSKCHSVYDRQSGNWGMATKVWGL